MHFHNDTEGQNSPRVQTSYILMVHLQNELHVHQEDKTLDLLLKAVRATINQAVNQPNSESDA